MNEGLPTYLLWSAAQREDRLRRSGLETLLVPAEGSGLGKGTTRQSAEARSYKQYYRVRVFNLEVLEIRPLGTGAAMKPASLPPVIRAGAARGNAVGEGTALADIALHGQERIPHPLTEGEPQGGTAGPQTRHPPAASAARRGKSGIQRCGRCTPLAWTAARCC
ncbi:hypothetical protein JI735_26380 [Paenibacillus sonchi]|uniref:Uncharacterized protein n=1 Tax=Paenibacillus sonchi TaxID=373687 RepID=A0A974P9R2_9BACL|nr:hypothetical protein [Paenibacillus sonchi]QQZ60049.1 hypothetical protein JI735_26380 [Paenibacillus sonchi]